MEFTRDIDVAKPCEAVWAFLWDVERVARCLPGCREVRTVVPQERYSALVGERVGPFTVQFPLEIQVLELEAPRRLRARAEGRDSKVGSSLRVLLDLALAPADGGCVVRVSTDTAVFGTLGTLGQGIIQRKAGQIMEQFASSLRRALEAEP